MIELDLNTLYKNAFGIRGIPVGNIQEPSIAAADQLDHNHIKPVGAQTLLYDSRLTKTTAIGTALFMPCMIGGIQLPNEPIITINIKKKVVETPLYGSKRKGTVKEIISIEDYIMSIKGVAINYNDSVNYPSDQVEQLNELFLKNEALEIICPLTQLLGIEYIVIKNFALPEMIGVQHAQAYQFAAVSDEEFILEEV